MPRFEKAGRFTVIQRQGSVLFTETGKVGRKGHARPRFFHTDEQAANAYEQRVTALERDGWIKVADDERFGTGATPAARQSPDELADLLENDLRAKGATSLDDAIAIFGEWCREHLKGRRTFLLEWSGSSLHLQCDLHRGGDELHRIECVLGYDERATSCRRGPPGDVAGDSYTLVEPDRGRVRARDTCTWTLHEVNSALGLRSRPRCEPRPSVH